MQFAKQNQFGIFNLEFWNFFLDPIRDPVRGPVGDPIQLLSTAIWVQDYILGGEMDLRVEGAIICELTST